MGTFTRISSERIEANRNYVHLGKKMPLVDICGGLVLEQPQPEDIVDRTNIIVLSEALKKRRQEVSEKGKNEFFRRLRDYFGRRTERSIFSTKFSLLRRLQLTD